jgi:uncharacterized phiE125 gp8 family phage protein
MMEFRVITDAVAEPLTLEEARDHLRLTPYGSPEEHPDDSYVTALISAAREWCEEYLRRALSTKIIEVAYDSFYDDDLKLPILPVQSITSVTYTDVGQVTTTLPTSVYNFNLFKNRIDLKYNQNWPNLGQGFNPVVVTAVVGYTNGESPEVPIPESIRRAMLLIIANLYENRQQDQLGSTRISFNSLPMGVYALLQPYRLGLGM